MTNPQTSEAELARLDAAEEHEQVSIILTLTMTGAEARNLLEHSEDWEEGLPESGEDLAAAAGEYIQAELESTIQFNTNTFPSCNNAATWKEVPSDQAPDIAATHTRQRGLVEQAAAMLEVTREAVAAWDAWRNNPMEYDDSPEPDYISQGRAILTKLEA